MLPPRYAIKLHLSSNFFSFCLYFVRTYSLPLGLKATGKKMEYYQMLCTSMSNCQTCIVCLSKLVVMWLKSQHASYITACILSLINVHCWSFPLLSQWHIDRRTSRVNCRVKDQTFEMVSNIKQCRSLCTQKWILWFETSNST